MKNFTQRVLITFTNATNIGWVQQVHKGVKILPPDAKDGQVPDTIDVPIYNEEELKALQGDLIHWINNCLRSFEVMTAHIRSNEIPSPSELFQTIRGVTSQHYKSDYFKNRDNKLVLQIMYETWTREINVYLHLLEGVLIEGQENEGQYKPQAEEVLNSIGRQMVLFAVQTYYSNIDTNNLEYSAMLIDNMTKMVTSEYIVKDE